MIEEAWEGKGIGPWFLRHLERVSRLIHVLAPREGEETLTQLVKDYQVVREELVKYGNAVAEKPEIVVVNKCELVESNARAEISHAFEKQTGNKLYWVSAGMREVGELVKVLG